MKIIPIGLGLLLSSNVALACPLCHTGTGALVRAGIFGEGDFFFNLLATLSPFPAAGTLLGIGLDGFVDGIVLHQILQVHNILSNKRFPDSVANIEINMFWDGLFHATTWTVTVIGLLMLRKAVGRGDVPRTTRGLVGSMVLGWGISNLVEGIIDHQILGVHHDIQRAPQPEQLYWDLALSAVGGVLLIAIGWVNIRKAISDSGVTASRCSELPRAVVTASIRASRPPQFKIE